LSESASPALAPWGIPEELADDPPELEDLLVLDEGCELWVVAGLDVVALWLGLEPQPAATRATMRSAPAASRRASERGREIMVFAPLEIILLISRTLPAHGFIPTLLCGPAHTSPSHHRLPLVIAPYAL
jgi:hypothetical protein